MNNIYFIIISLCLMIYMIREIRQKQFNVKESFWWMIASIIMLFLSIFPYSIDKIANKIGIDYPPALLFSLCIVFLVFINFKNSKIIAEQQIKISYLAQEISILKFNQQQEKNKGGKIK